MKWERNSDGTFSVSGDGPMRPIVVDAETRAIARQHWMDEYGNQHAEQEAHTARYVQHMEKNEDDYRRMAREAHAYKGDF